MLQKINILTLFSALALFFLPWLDLRCSGKSLYTQTGFQTVCGASTPAPEMKAQLEQMRALSSKSASPMPESMGISLLSGGALLAIACGLIFSFVSLRDGRRSLAPGLLAAIALVLLVTQMMIEFPAKGVLEKSLLAPAGERTRNDPSAGGDAALAAATMRVEVIYQHALYIELALLGIPTLILVNSLLDRLRKNSGLS